MEKYIAFELGDNVYALSLSRVKEVIRKHKITHIPKTPNYMLGIINLRGNIIPIIDLCLKFNITKKNTNEESVIIIELDSCIAVGILVNSVNAVIDIDPDKINSQSNPLLKIDTKIYSYNENKNIIILEPNNLFDQNLTKYSDVKSLEQAS